MGYSTFRRHRLNVFSALRLLCSTEKTCLPVIAPSALSLKKYQWRDDHFSLFNFKNIVAYRIAYSRLVSKPSFWHLRACFMPSLLPPQLFFYTTYFRFSIFLCTSFLTGFVSSVFRPITLFRTWGQLLFYAYQRRSFRTTLRHVAFFSCVAIVRYNFSFLGFGDVTAITARPTSYPHRSSRFARRLSFNGAPRRSRFGESSRQFFFLSFQRYRVALRDLYGTGNYFCATHRLRHACYLLSSYRRFRRTRAAIVFRRKLPSARIRHSIILKKHFVYPRALTLFGAFKKRF